MTQRNALGCAADFACSRFGAGRRRPGMTQWLALSSPTDTAGFWFGASGVLPVMEADDMSGKKEYNDYYCGESANYRSAFL